MSKKSEDTSVIEITHFDKADETHHGKVRDSFLIANKRIIVVSDRISAFDYHLGSIPGKGAVLNQIAAWWFNKLNAIGIKHHLISTPHSNISVVKNASVIPLEIIVRGYLTGSTKTSSWYAYQHLNRRICGIEMPKGMVKNQAFDHYLVTPTSKPETGHDESVSKQQILASSLLAPFANRMKISEDDLLEKIHQLALKMFAFGQKIARKNGLILVDTKYELGIDENNELIVIDEVHTPDSSRYWIGESYQKRFKAALEPDSLDKEFVRTMIVNNGYDVEHEDNPADYLNENIIATASEKYIQLFKTITGETVKFDKPQDIVKVIEKVTEGG